MKYSYSDVDRSNLAWLDKDLSKATLKSIELTSGNLRGLYKFEINFKYPISAIAGKNGSGKSTILAMAACAFHNNGKGYKKPERKHTYYTFSDFFVQSVDEIPPRGIYISYGILHNNWRKSPGFPEGTGLGYQSRSKPRNGKWENYRGRVNRNVIFYGIDRVVPHAERSVSKSYRKWFHKAAESGFETKVSDTVGRILKKKYEGFWVAEHSKYRLPHVKIDGGVYSGFNMGAGENALFDIFTTIYTCPPGFLLVIDEIELGLHEEAQRLLIQELKQICRDLHIQVICTTHSPAILAALPPEGRFLIQSGKKSSTLVQGVSPAMAMGHLAAKNSKELEILVEDGMAKLLLESVLDYEIRKRIIIQPIGSDEAVLRHLVSKRKSSETEVLMILDADKSGLTSKMSKKFLAYLESSKSEVDDKAWFENRCLFLPGTLPPERWIAAQLLSFPESATVFKVTKELIKEAIEEFDAIPHHNLSYFLAEKFHMDKDLVVSKMLTCISLSCGTTFEPLGKRIAALLS